MDARFIVFYDADAVRELEALKSLKGEAGLLELRPRQGGSPVRPIFRRMGNVYVILAFSMKPDKADFKAALAAARKRSLRYRVDVLITPRLSSSR
jgi:hypothetical protein